MDIQELSDELTRRLLGMPKAGLAGLLGFMVDHSYGLSRLYKEEHGEKGMAVLEERVREVSNRSKKGLIEEIQSVYLAYPAAALWLMGQFFDLNGPDLRKISGDSVPLLLESRLEPGFRVRQLWFFMDLLYQQAASGQFKYAVSMGTGLYFYVINHEKHYDAADVEDFEGLLYDFFEGMKWQLEADSAQRDALYQTVSGQLERNRGVYPAAHSKKIRSLARVLKAV
ncbi:MAG: hypothetical protein FWF59_11275 [Turicibacter sp.]|nr:hypothetical protein [Turicibacter sp.]